jgi:hypothetical protein
MEVKMKKTFFVTLVLVLINLLYTSVITVGSTQQYSQIQDAVDIAAYNDEICVYPGTYEPVILPQMPINIYSADGPECTVIDGSNTTTVFTIGNNTQYQDHPITIDGFTIINGYTEYHGAGLKIQYSNATLKNMIIHNNTSNLYGGGIYSHDSNVYLYNCAIYNNAASSKGGGLFVNSNTNNKEFIFADWNSSIYSNISVSNIGSDIFSTNVGINAILLEYTIENPNSYGDLYTGYHQNVTIEASSYIITSINPYNQINDIATVKVYPNPCTSQVYLTCDNYTEYMVMIYNSKGQLVRTAQGNSPNLNIAVTDYTPGLYLCQIKTSNKNIYKKLTIINKN